MGQVALVYPQHQEDLQSQEYHVIPCLLEVQMALGVPFLLSSQAFQVGLEDLSRQGTLANQMVQVSRVCLEVHVGLEDLPFLIHQVGRKVRQAFQVGLECL